MIARIKVACDKNVTYFASVSVRNRLVCVSLGKGLLKKHSAVVSGLDPPQVNCDLTHEYMSGKGGRSHKSVDTDLQDLPQQF